MFEGEDTPQATDADLVANQVARLLANGQGGFDWAGLPLIVGWLGVQDLEGLMNRLTVMKLHKPDKDGA